MDDAGNGTDFEAAMRQFRSEFARQLPSRLEESRQRLAACVEQPGDDARLRDLHLTVHKLVGASGTFGMLALGEAAQAAENMVLELLERPDRTVADLQPLAAAVEAVVQAAGAQ